MLDFQINHIFVQLGENLEKGELIIEKINKFQ